MELKLKGPFRNVTFICPKGTDTHRYSWVSLVMNRYSVLSHLRFSGWCCIRLIAPFNP
jgi:hypothetical protein